MVFLQPKLPPSGSALFKIDGGTPVARRRALLLCLGVSGAAVVAAEKAGLQSLPSLLDQLPSQVPDSARLTNVSVSADGWRLNGRLAGLAPGGVAPLTGWSEMPKRGRLTVAGPGWTTTGEHRGFQPRQVRANDGVRRMWEQGVSEPTVFAATPYVLDAIGNDLALEFAATRFIYAGENVLFSAAPGWFAGAEPISDRPVSNYSSLSYSKGMIDWVEPQREQLTGTFKLRITAGFHLEGRDGRPFAAVKVTGTPWDPVINGPLAAGTPVTRLAVYEWSGPPWPGRGSAVWAAEFSESDFSTGPGLVHFTFEDCPWVGNNASQRSAETRLALNPRTTSFSAPGEYSSIGCGIHPVLKWVGPIANQRHIYVARAGNALGLVGDDVNARCQPSYEAARANPFATFDKAWQALFDLGKDGQADASGAIIWLSDGTHPLPPSGFTGTQRARRANDIAVTIETDPAAVFAGLESEIISTGATRYILFAAPTGVSTSFVILRRTRLRATPNNIGVFTSAGPRSTYFYFDDARVADESGSDGYFINGGAVVSARDSLISKTGSDELFSAANSAHICLHFHNCETNASLNANVVWGLNLLGVTTGKPFQLGSSTNVYLRATNLVAGYINAPQWDPTTSGAFLRQASIAAPLVEDWGLSVALCKTSYTTFNSTLIKAGEVIDQSYRNLICEAVTTVRPSDAPLQGGTLGLNFHNDPKTIPTANPGNDFDRCSIRNSNLCRMAVKGPFFFAVNGNGRKAGFAAKYLTGGRNVRQGVGMYGLVVGSRHDNNALHCNGPFSIWGSQTQVYRMSYADELAGDLRPTAGFVGIPADLIGHGFDLNGDPMFLDGRDAPGAFRRA